MINKNRFILFLLFLLIIAIPVSFAADNATYEVISENGGAVSENSTIISSDDEEILGASDVYFDASASSGGDGSQSRPYNTVTSSNLGSKNHFKQGTYSISSPLSSFISYEGLSFIGENKDNTILQYLGSDTFITTGNSITFTGITIKGGSIQTSGGTLTATDTIFDSGVAKIETESDNYKYGNSYGGAIKQSASTGLDWGSIFGGGSSSTQTINIDNCIFRNNFAAYGGAIYSEKGTVTISNSRFENNHAENGGGAISVLNGAALTVDNCEFINDYSLYDAGGAIYVFNATSASIKNSQFLNCHAAIGGALASLRSPVTISSSTFSSNKANWTGGAVFSMFGRLTSTGSDYYENSAYHGGAIYADNLTYFEVNGGIFQNNQANGSAGAIFAFTNLVNRITNPTYTSNTASEHNDLYQTDSITLNIGSDDYEMIQYKSSYAGTLPSKYDLRTVNGVTPVKDQGQSGNCWAFATMATLESAILKATGKKIILSEGNLKNLANIYSDIGWRYETNNGGKYPFVYGYLTSWAGPVLNSLDPTDDWDVIAPIINSAVHVQNILFLQRTSYTDNNAIKKAIMDYGAVCSEIYWSTSYLNGNNYYYTGSEGRNHAISVVGWDDTKSISGAPGAGAWIIKNSYGPHRGDGGYYYVSYYDKSLFRVYDESYNSFAVVFNDTIRFNKNYQYDAAFTDYFLTPTYNKVMWYKNTFTSTGNDILSAFSTYFRKVTNWEAQIFVNDELKTTQSGKANPGYWTINLNEQIPLKLDDTFTISLKIECSSTADIPISESGPDYTLVKQYFKQGISYFSFDGVNWNDFYGYESSFGSGDSGHNYFNQVACLKAFTKEGPKVVLNTSIEILNVNNTSVEVKVLDQNGGIINTGEVEFTIDGTAYKCDVVNSVAVLDTYLKAGSHTIHAAYLENQYYNSSEISKTVYVGRDTPVISIIADDIQYGQDLPVRIIIANSIGEEIPLSFTVHVNGDTYTQREFVLSNPSPNDYIISVQTAQSDDFNSKTTNKTVKVTTAKPAISLEIADVTVGEKIQIKVKLSNNITDKVNVLIDGKNYPINVSNGFGAISIENTLSANSYEAEATFNGNEYYSKVSAHKIFNVVKITPALSIFDDDIVEGETALIKVYLPKDIDDEIVLSIKSQTITSKASNGEATFTVPELGLGKYNYTIKFNGNMKYNSASLTDSLEVLEKAKKTADLKVTDIINANSISISVELPEDVAGSVTLNFNSLKFTKTPVNGKTSFKINNLDNGIYDYTVTFSGDLNYKAAESKRSAVISNKLNPNILVHHIIDGCDVVINVEFQNDSEGNVTLIFNNKTLSQQLKDSKASFAINDLDCGTYSYTVFFNGDLNYNPISRDGYLTISEKIQGNSSIKAEDMIRSYLSAYDYQATFLKSDGTPLANSEVTFIVNGNEYNVKTDDYGIACLSNKFNVGKYEVFIENPATGLNMTKSMTIVKRITGNKDVSVDYSYASDFKIRLYDDNGQVAGAGETVTFRLNGVAYNANTDKNGYAVFKIKNLLPKTYVLTCEYNGVEVSNNVVVKQILKASNKKFKRYSVKKYTATLKTSKGKAIKGKTVKFKINGKTYKSKTNKRGMASIKIKSLFKTGKYKMVITYLKTSIKKTVKIVR